MSAVILKKILHVDDDTVMRMMVKKALERSEKGFEILSCSSAREFLEKIETFTPDLLLIDVIMPDMRGPDLLAKVRQKSITAPAVFMTGQDDLEIDNRDRLEPIIGIMQKPFSATTLGEDLIRLWDRHQA
jgi:two-component system OmpR family response regulator